MTGASSEVLHTLHSRQGARRGGDCDAAPDRARFHRGLHRAHRGWSFDAQPPRPSGCATADLRAGVGRFPVVVRQLLIADLDSRGGSRFGTRDTRHTASPQEEGVRRHARKRTHT